MASLGSHSSFLPDLGLRMWHWVMILPAPPWVWVGPEMSSPNMLWPLGPEGDLDGMHFLEPDCVSLRAYKQGLVGGP